MKMKNGWASFPVDDEIIERAIEIRRSRDKLYKNIFQEKKSDMRHVGEIGEFCFDHFLESYGTGLSKWIVDGKVTNEADFIFANQRIGVKTVKRTVDMKMSYGAQITAKHKDEPVDYYFFCCYEVHRKRMILLGGIAKSDFLRQAQHYKAGDVMHHSYKIREKHGIYNISVDKLMSPEDFVGSILFKYTTERRLSRGSGAKSGYLDSCLSERYGEPNGCHGVDENTGLALLGQ